MLAKKVWSIVAAIIVVIAGGLLFAYNNRVKVLVTTVKNGSIQQSIELRGRVELDQTMLVYTQTAGKIFKMFMNEGEWVAKGVELARLDLAENNLAMEKAKELYLAAQIELNALEQSIRSQQLKDAQAKVEEAKAALVTARKEYHYKLECLAKARQLKEQDPNTEANYTDAQLLANNAAEMVKELERRLEIAQYNVSLLMTTVSPEDLAVARARVEQTKSHLLELERNAERSVIVAPIAGTILSRFVKEGEVVATGTELYEIGDYDSAYVRIDVLVDDATKIQLGQKVWLTGEILNGQQIAGEIYYIAPKAEKIVSSLGVEQQRVMMKIHYNQAAYNFRPGYEVDVKIITARKEKVLYIPERAIFGAAMAKQVFLVRKDHLELRKIEVGIESQEMREITAGLKLGEKVVLDPENNLKPGLWVKQGQ